MHDSLAARFESYRRHLLGVAYRMLGSRAEAEDAVQEAWLRASRADSSEVENLGGWLTTILARVCLDMLRSRKARREEFGEESRDVHELGTHDPEAHALLGDSVSAALMIVLQQLSPPERVAFVLHDLFDIPFEQIAPVIGKSVIATRQLASRGRRRVRQITADPTARAHEEVVRAFLRAAREGDFETLIQLLDPSAVLRADAVTVAMGSDAEVQGGAAIATWFDGKAKAAQPALIDGAPGLAWVAEGSVRVAFSFGFNGERIASIDLTADQQTLAAMHIEIEAM